MEIVIRDIDEKCAYFLARWRQLRGDIKIDIREFRRDIVHWKGDIEEVEI